MRRRSFVLMGVGGSFNLSGCTGSVRSLTEPDRSDLSEHDENAIQHYEEAYESSQAGSELYEEGIAQFNEIITEHGGEAVNDYNERIQWDEWQSMLSLFSNAIDDFEEANEYFTTSRQISESPSFAEPCLNASNWARAHIQTSQRFHGMTRKEEIQNEIESAENKENPISPEEVLQLVLSEY